MLPLLSIAIFSSAALTIRAEYNGPRSMVYLFKPLTTLLIVYFALSADWQMHTAYQKWILAGLVFSLFGDIFLMLPKDRFIPGLISFLIAHIFYIVAFSLPHGFQWGLFSLVIFLIYALFFFKALLPFVPGALKIAVIIYGIALMVMGWQAMERWLSLQNIAALFAFSGAVFFIVSDSLLALNRFKTKFNSAQLMVLSTYFLAQWLIALSLF